ncbi:aminotransferase class I/II-fold pyridoxal phosphate-dependent enzyme [Bacillus sp. CRN 9]|nr:aminotransferase class I/II-fold pyridoxal phosphate-dependent enzyme [Bacillus sp. CRN 9]
MTRSLNSRVLQLEVPGIRKISNQLTDYPDAINLTIGQPDFPTPSHIKEAAITSILEDYSTYTHNAGLLQLREEVQAFYEDQYGVHYDANDEVIITIGASEAIDTAFRTILEEGDEVILFAPAYTGYIPLIELCGAKPVIIDTTDSGFKPTLKQLELAVTKNTKAVLFNYPSNPTGVVLSADDLLPIAEWLKSQEVYIISDEIYSEITYEKGHACIAAFEGMRERTLVINGLSKSHSMTGWRLGYILAPKYISDQMVKVHLYHSVCASITSQYAAIAALKHGRDDPKRMKLEYQKRRDFVYAKLKQMGLEVEKPEGSFYIFPKIPATFKDAQHFASLLLKQGGVAVVPGSAFTPFGESYIRITYAYSMEMLIEAMDRLERFLQGQQPIFTDYYLREASTNE